MTAAAENTVADAPVSDTPAMAPPPVAPRPAATPVSTATVTRTAPASAPPTRSFPAWLASLLTAAGILIVLAGVYFFISPSRRSQPSETAQTALEPVPAASPAAPSPHAKNLELTGFRIKEDKNQRVEVRFVVVNHSGAELPPLKGDLILNTGRADAVIDLPFMLPSLGPFESREITSNTKTTVRAYELPDWQFIKPTFTITEQK